MRIVIDTDRCTGHGQCYFAAPELFSDDERGYGEVRGEGAVTAAHLEAATQAVRLCPEAAIDMLDRRTDTGER